MSRRSNAILVITVVLLVVISAISIQFLEIFDENDETTYVSPDGDDPSDDDQPADDSAEDENNSTSTTTMKFPYTDIRQFTVLDPETYELLGTSRYAVFDVSRGGNSYEHYLATTQSGWIVNIGGDYPYWSSDRGVTWNNYPPDIPVSGGEGAVMETPDGNIVGMSWWPYDGDMFVSYYFDADSGQWSWQYNRLHMAFYDRPWIVVVPGPITTPAGTFPWVSLVASNAWKNSGLGFVVSIDGLNYAPLPGPQAVGTTADFDLDFDSSIAFDFLTPHREIDLTPLPIGGALWPNWSGSTNAYLKPDLTWAFHDCPDGPIPADHLVVDSSGALHSVEASGNSITHFLSLDGGKSWESEIHTWPNATEVEEWEFQADGNRELAVIYMRAQESEVDKDILFHIRDYRESMKADSLTLIGKGDVDTTSGVGSTSRFDFASLAILPDGGAVVSFRDSSPNPPHIAIELEMPYADNPFLV